MLSAVAVPKGTTLIMSLLAANHNRDLWGEDASEWRPERWLGASDTGETTSSATTEKAPGVKDGMKYPGVYASM